VIKKFFVLGLPGCGKSSAARYIEMLAHDIGTPADVIQDYRILYEMFVEDREGRFSSTWNDGYDGFNVLDLSACNDALVELACRVQEIERASQDDKVIIIEFARDDYCEALRLFPLALLQNAYFLFIDAEVEACRQRVKARVANPETPDDHYVSDYIFKAYYNKKCQQSLISAISCLREDFHISEGMITLINNTARVSRQEFLAQTEVFVTPILKSLVPVAS